MIAAPDRRATSAAARRFAAFAGYADPPAEVLEAVARQVLDTLGIGLAAHALRHRPRLEEAICGFGAGFATGIGSAEPMSAPAAALLNGCLAHALEADDTHTGSVMHGSSILVPAALATAEERDAGGRELLRAIAVAWEVMIRIGYGFPGALSKHGFHATALAGPFAAAVACGALRRLTEDEMVSALGIAGSQSSGLFAFLADGAESKWLHGGWPALGGLVAAGLAAGGMTGPETIFEGGAGFAAAFARQADGAAALADACNDLGDVWHCRDVAAKLYPTCHFIQPFIECTEILLRDTPPERVVALTCFVPATVAALVCEPWASKLHPATLYQAKWSLPYCLASLMVHGRIGVDTFDRAALDDAVLGQAHKVGYEVVETAFPRHYPGRVRALLDDGTERTIAVEDVLGSPARPLGDASLLRKFREYAGPSLRAGGADQIVAAVDGLRSNVSARSLGQVLRRSLRPQPSASGRAATGG